MRTFSELTDQEKESRFFETAAILCEVIDEEGYQILHRDLEISDEEIRDHQLLPDAVLMAHGVEVKKPRGSTFRVFRVINKMDEEDPVSLILACKSGGPKIQVGSLLELSDKELEQFEALFNAKVLSSHKTDAGLELIIEDIDPKLMAALNRKLEAHTLPQQATPTLQM